MARVSAGRVGGFGGQHVGAAVGGGAVQHLKEEGKHLAVVGELGRVQEAEPSRVFGGVVAHQLPLLQLEKQQVVHPHQAQSQGHFFGLGRQGVAVGARSAAVRLLRP